MSLLVACCHSRVSLALSWASPILFVLKLKGLGAQAPCSNSGDYLVSSQTQALKIAF